MTASKTEQIKAMVLLNTACILWACNILFGRMLREFIGPLFIIAVRSVVGALVFALVVWFFGRRDLLRRVADWPTVILMGLCGVVLFQIMFYYALRYTSVLNVGLLNGFIPLATALLAMVFLRERMMWQQWLALLTTIAGIIWIMSGGEVSNLLQLTLNTGDILMLGAVFSWAIYGILGKRLMNKLTVMEVTALGLFVAVLPVLPMASWEATIIPPELNLFVIFALVFICIGPTILCLFWWNMGVKLIGPAHAAIYMNLVPVYAALLSYFFLGETLGWHHLGGGILVLGASLFVGLVTIRTGQP
jgi:drug/metabolite transporter (DMT)-like permease